MSPIRRLQSGLPSMLWVTKPSITGVRWQRKDGAGHGRQGIALVEAERAEAGVGARHDGVHARLQAGIEHGHVALHVIGRGVVFLVVGRAVVALAIVLEHDLPVGLHHVVDLVGDLGALQRMRLHLAPDGGQRVGEVGRRRRPERDEQQAGGVLERDRPQRQLRLVDAELAATCRAPARRRARRSSGDRGRPGDGRCPARSCRCASRDGGRHCERRGSRPRGRAPR